MAVTLYCADFHPVLEQRFTDVFRLALASRKEVFGHPILVVVPSRALRSRLLSILAESQFENLFDVHFYTLNHLSIRLALDSPNDSSRVVSDSVFFPYALYQIASQTGPQRFQSFRIGIALYQSIRDLIDGAISPTLLREALQFAEQDPELKHTARSLTELSRMYDAFQQLLNSEKILNLHTAAAQAAQFAPEWISTQNIRSILTYGFYDTTQTQFDLLDSIFRTVHLSGGDVSMFFPFHVSEDHIVHLPAEYAQEFYYRIQSLTESLGGQIDLSPTSCSEITKGVESRLFSRTEPLPEEDRPQSIEYLSCAGTYDEAWAIAKEILHLVRSEGVSWDRIQVVCRSLNEVLLPLSRAFDENLIPSNLRPANTISHLPFARFAILTLQVRESEMSNSQLLQFLASPFQSDGSNRDFKNLSDILERLIIKNWGDWTRLEPLLEGESLPEIFEFIDESNEDRLDSYRRTAGRLIYLQRILRQIPDRSTLPRFAEALLRVLRTLSVKDEKASAPIYALLERIAGDSILDQMTIRLGEFVDLLQLYFIQTPFEGAETVQNYSMPGWQPPEVPGTAQVQVGDIMQLRGVPADYVFLIGCNKDIWPRRIQEDPFLPDETRKQLRTITGAGPSPKATKSRLIPLKEGTQEELLLFSLALKSARKRLFLSFQRADNQGRKLSCSTYIDEILRLSTGITSEENSRIQLVPKHHRTKFQDDRMLPSPLECSTLSSTFSPNEAMTRLYTLSVPFTDHLNAFSGRLNAQEIEPANLIDGTLHDPNLLWKSVYGNMSPEEWQLSLSYSRFKGYQQCPFQFYATNLLRLRDTPKEMDETGHDLSNPMKGRLAEDVIKEACNRMRIDNKRLEEAVGLSTDAITERNLPLYPASLLHVYMKQFQRAAILALQQLKNLGLELTTAETPQYENMIRVELRRSDNVFPQIVLRGIPDLLIFTRDGKDGLIGEFKWGAKSTGNTPAYCFSNNEAQFCFYPMLLEHDRGWRLPFQYFRLDAYARYGLPNKIVSRIRKLLLASGHEQAERFFGGRASYDDRKPEDRIPVFIDKIHEQIAELLQGNFRIIKDPGMIFTPCTSCSFTQLCRKSHTATLLRSKSVERK